MIHVVGFVLGGALVVAVGIALARYADAIAEATGLGRLWVGVVLLAGATSLPELATDLVAVRIGAVDLAVGDLFGSSMANMLILALIDLLPPRRRVLEHVAFDHALAASLAIALNAFAGALIIVQPSSSVFGLSPGALVLFVLYLAGTRAVYRHAHRERPPASPATEGAQSPAVVRVDVAARARGVAGCRADGILRSRRREPVRLERDEHGDLPGARRGAAWQLVRGARSGSRARCPVRRDPDEPRGRCDRISRPPALRDARAGQRPHPARLSRRALARGGSLGRTPPGTRAAAGRDGS